MRGNNKPARGLFSGMKRTVVASATALSLAVGGMAVPAIPTPAGDSLLPAASAGLWSDYDPNDPDRNHRDKGGLMEDPEVSTDGNTYSLRQTFPLIKWKGNDLANAPTVLRELSQKAENGNYFSVVSSPTETREFNKITFNWPLKGRKPDDFDPSKEPPESAKVARTKENMFRAGETYYVWLEQINAQGKRVLNDRVVEVVSETEGDALVLTLDEPMVLEKSANADTHLIAYGPGLNGPLVHGGKNHASVKLSETAPQKYTISGTVTGNPVENTPVLVRESQSGEWVQKGTVTGGKFTTEDLDAGTYEVKIKDTPTTEESEVQEVTLGPDEPAAPLTFAVKQKQGKVNGTVSAPISFTGNILIELIDENGNRITSTSDRYGNGEFEFKAPAGQYTVKASALDSTGYAPATVGVTLEPGKTVTGLKLELEANPATYRGHIVDPNEDGVSGVTVTVTNGNQSFKGTTDPNGYFVIEGIPEGEYTVELSKSDSTKSKELSNVTFAPAENKNAEKIDVEFQERSITGTVIDSETGKLVSNETVELRDGDNTKLTEATTDAQGRYLFENLLPGRYEISAESETYGRGTVNVKVPTTSDLKAENLELAFGTGTLKARACYGDGGQGRGCEAGDTPAPDVPVRLFKDGVQIREGVTTGPDASFTFEDIKEGDYELQFGKTKVTPGSTKKDVSIKPGKVKSFSTLLDRNRSSISGSVTIDGDQASNLKVILEGNGKKAERETNNQGRFDFPDLEAGSYTVKVEATDTYGEESVTTNLRWGDTKPDLNIKVETDPGSVTGRVVDEDGNPIEGADVTVGSAPPAKTNKEGIFTVKGLKRSAAKKVTVTVLGGETYDKVTRKEKVEILPAEDNDIGDIQVTRNPGLITGTVTTDEGTRLASGTATISRADGFSTEATITNGEYEVPNLKPGEYTLSVGSTSLTASATKKEKVVVESDKVANGDIEVRRFLGTYEVTVHDDLGKEIQGASVTLTGKGFSRTETTKADGVATFDKVPPGKYDYVVAGADEYKEAKGSPEDMGPDETIELNVYVQPTDGRVEGTVRDDAGNALSGVEVEIRGTPRVDTSKTYVSTTLTDDDGNYNFDGVTPGEYTVVTEESEAYRPGYAEVSVQPKKPTRGEIKADRKNGSIAGNIINDNDETVAEATVLLKSADGQEEVARTEANAEGGYDFTDVRPGEYRLEVVSTDRYKGEPSTVQVNPGKPTPKNLIVSRSAGAINGTVIDESGKSVEGADVTIIGVDGKYTTDSNGEFTVEGLAPGTYTAKVAKTTEHGPATEYVDVEPGEPAPLKLTVTRNKSIVNGVVLDDAGQAVNGPDVRILDSSNQPAVDVHGNDVSQATIHGQGRFTVNDLVPGKYTASVSGDQTYESGNATFTVTEGEFTDLVEITVQRKPGTLEGRIIDVNDSEKAVTDAKLTLVKEGEEDGEPIDVKEDGSFKQLFPAGRYTLHVESPEYYAPYPAKTIDVPAGNSVTPKIELTSTVGVLAGSVTDEDGNGLPTTVSIRNLQNGVSRGEKTNEKGEYSVENLEVGTYRVTVAAPEGFDAPERQEVDVTPSQTASADFTLSKTPEAPKEGSASGEVLADDGNVVDGVNVHLKNTETEEVFEATVDENGRFNASGLPAGDYNVIVSVDGYKAQSTPRATVIAGENTPIGRITIVKDEAPQGTFRAEVSDRENGEPIPGVKLVVSGNEIERVLDTDIEGVAFGKLPVGKYSVTATPADNSGYMPSQNPTAFEIEATEQSDVFIGLDRKPEEQEKPTTGTVTGSIRDQNGDPVEGTTAELRGDDGKTIDLEVDENGDFNLPEVPEGEYTVVVTPGDGHRTPRYQEIEVTPGESTDVGRITTPTKKKQLDESDKGKPGTINGWLVDDMNEPIPGATVVITGKGTDTDADGNPIDTYPAVSVDPDGRFTTDELPEGEYEIDLELPEGWDKPEGWPKSVTVTKDEPQHQGVINVEAPRSEIKGAVVDGKGNPIDDVVVTVTDSHGDTKEVPVDENGEYALDVVPGDAVVEVFTPEDVQDVDPMYIPVRPKIDVELPTVNLTEKTLKLQKRVLGWDADSPEDAPGLPKDEKLVYGFIVTNESDEKVTKVQIEDPFAGASIKAPEGFDGSIEPGDHVVFSAVMDAPYDSGAFANIAVARGLAQDGSMVASTPNEAYVTFMDMSLKKKVNAQFASNAKDPVKMAADRDLYFTYEVVNTGSVRMENVAVRDTIYEGDEKDFNPDNPGKGTPMEIIAPEGFTGTLMPGERAVFKGILPPLKPGTRHHNAAEASGEAPEPPKRSKIFEDEPDYGDDPSGLLVVSPKENIDGNAHIVVEEGAPLPAITDINGSLYVDVNEDGKRDEGDKPYGGMEVTLHSADGLPAVTETSDSNGEFVFKGVNAGNYTLQMRNPGGVILAEPLDEEKNDNGIGATLESKEFEVTGDEEALDKEISLLDRPIEIPEEPTPTPEPAPEGSSLGKCISETSSVSNPATWLIPIGILIAAMGGAAVLFEDQFNAAAAEFNKAMPSLNIQRPEWMNQISRQLAEIDPAVPAVALAVGIIAIGALVLGLTYASCESGKDFGSSNGEGSSSKDGDSSSKDEETAEPTEPAEESEESEDSEDKLTTAAVPAE